MVLDGLGQVLASHEENREAERRRRNLREVVSVSDLVSVRMHVQTRTLEAVYTPPASRFSHAPSDTRDVPRLCPVPAGSGGKLARVGLLHVSSRAPHANRVSLKRLSSLDVSTQVRHLLFVSFITLQSPWLAMDVRDLLLFVGQRRSCR